MESRWSRIVAHADMDAFFAAVEQLDRRELRGKPVIVGFPSPRSVVSTASYEARRFGVGSAMPMVRAMERCPSAIVVPPRFARYSEVSRQVMEALSHFSPAIEPLSLDEAFLELTGSQGLFGDPVRMGEKIRAAVREATGGLTVSVGISTSKFVAKVASDHRKPDGLTIVPPAEVVAFLRPLPVRRLWGVGPKAAERLHRLGLRTIGDVADSSRSFLEAELGPSAEHLRKLAVGDDPRPVVADRERKSVGAEETLATDRIGEASIRPLLLPLAEKVAERLRRKGLRARGVRVKLKTNSFRLHARQSLLARATSSAEDLYRAALRLLRHFDFDEPVRLVGIATFELVEGEDLQRELFAPPEEKRRQALDETLDALRARFGEGAIRRGDEPL